MSDQLGFEAISADEFAEATKPSPRRASSKTPKGLPDERTITTWLTLDTRLGECTMPQHREVLERMGTLELEYRRRYPVRMVYKLSEELFMCRDCYRAEADREL